MFKHKCLFPIILILFSFTFSLFSQESKKTIPPPPKKVKGHVQVRPGGPMQETEMNVYPVPVDVPAVDADRANLKDDDLVLGVVVNGEAMAYPIRYLAMYEIVDDWVGKTPVAPSW